jgi:hypothetical protein
MNNDIEELLRSRMVGDHMPQYGGFLSFFDLTETEQEYSNKFGEEILGYTLIGLVGWHGYEEGSDATLWINPDDMLVIHHMGHSVEGDFGETFVNELEPTLIDDWLEML